MVHANNYEAASTLVKVMQKNRGLFYSGHGVVAVSATIVPDFRPFSMNVAT